MKTILSKPVFKLLCLIGILIVTIGCQRVEFEGDLIKRDAGTDTDVDSDSDNDIDIDNANDIDTEINLKYNGVDLLIMVDNSGSMEQEQEILATSIYTLIDSLVNPIPGPDWPFPPIQNMRVAVVSSDLGLQYGENHSTEGFPYGDTVVTSCTDRSKKGDNGGFQTDMDGTVEINSGEISCVDDGGQCPSDRWTCEDGKCFSPSGDKGSVKCIQTTSDGSWTETSRDNRNPNLATQVACISRLGTGGCGKEQQLEASVVALSKESQKSFIKDDHLLAVLIVTDEEDCSIKDKGLFETDEWKSGTRMTDDKSSGLLNVCCNFPKSNEENFLFNTDRYWNELIKMKDNKASGVIFAAIVGVPPNDKEKKSPCQGQGNELGSCLGVPSMQLQVELQETNEGQSFKHFKPACERMDDSYNTITSARPGRRYVQVAQEFASSGYVYSICNADWSPAMKELSKMIAQRID
ncbi:MAG: hypothetical protein GY847_21885 [Proteobacteria bacterium]|nr:hypothetical protein [Pseudomonadota bacterium]